MRPLGMSLGALTDEGVAQRGTVTCGSHTANSFAHTWWCLSLQVLLDTGLLLGQLKGNIYFPFRRQRMGLVCFCERSHEDRRLRRVPQEGVF